MHPSKLFRLSGITWKLPADIFWLCTGEYFYYISKRLAIEVIFLSLGSFINCRCPFLVQGGSQSSKIQ